LTTLVQPKLEPPKKEPKPKAEPDDDDPDQAIAGGTRGGTAGGTVGGTIGGTVGGTPGGAVGGVVGGQGPKAAGPTMVAPQLGALQKESGADPVFPAILRRPGMVYTVLTKICVSRTGSVDSVTLLRGAASLLDGNVLSAVKG